MPKSPSPNSTHPFRLTRRAALSAAAATLGDAVLSPARAADDSAAEGPVLGAWTHAYAAFGKPKYPRGFDHFEYVNPAAPKGGTLYLRNPDRRSSFDKFNYYTLRGNAPAGVQIFMMEPLAVLSGDEPMTMYGLVAEQMQVAPDKSWIAFRIHPKARFNNGDPVTAADVKHTFDQLAGAYSDPQYQAETGGVAKSATVLDDRTVRFDMREKTNDGLFAIGHMKIFSRKWGVGADGKTKRFDEIISEYPIATGPYKIAVADSGRRLELQLDPNYWARDLGVRKGFFNFDRVIYRFYKDQAVGREAFKAGEFYLYKEYGARSWVRLHKGQKWDDGRIKKQIFETSVGEGLQSFQLNLRRDKFKDIRVREALGYTYDFETLNRYKSFKRANSVFNNSEFAAEGLPSPGELKLLEPFRKELPAAVFGPAFVAPVSDNDPIKLRANILKARDLFEQAGWKLAPDGAMRNARGEPFELEYLAPGDARRMPEWETNLRKLGISLKIRSVDFALYARRLQEFDFDTVTIVEGAFTLPDVNSTTRLYGSSYADIKGSDNTRGVKSPAADALLVAMGTARTMAELRDASRAFDRLVMWSYWQIPDLYASGENVSYWNRFGIPATRPGFYTIESALTEMPAWAVTAWWMKDLPASTGKTTP